MEKKISRNDGFLPRPWTPEKGRIGASTTGERIMRREHFDGRRFVVQVLLGVNLLIWGACLAWAEEKDKPAEYASDAFNSAGKNVHVWRFDPKAEGKRPAVLLLHGADGGVGVEGMYCAAAKRLADKGFVVFIVHYLDATKPEDGGEISDLVKRAVRGEATKKEKLRVQRYFAVWTGCVSDAVRYVRKQPAVDGEPIGIVGLSLGGFVGLSCAADKKLNVAAVVSGFGGLPKEKRDTVKWLPPTLVVHGEKDEVVPVAEAHALKELADANKLPITVKIYPNVGHVFGIGKGKFDVFAFSEAEQLMMKHLDKHLKP
jgi:carboxymethylenebutenolidase